MKSRSQAHIQPQLQAYRWKYFPSRPDVIGKLNEGWCLAFSRVWLCCMYETHVAEEPRAKYTLKWYDDVLDTISGWDPKTELSSDQRNEINDLVRILWHMKKSFLGSTKITMHRVAEKERKADSVDEPISEIREEKTNPTLISQDCIAAPMTLPELGYILSQMALEKRQIEIIAINQNPSAPLNHDVALVYQGGKYILYDPLFHTKEVVTSTPLEAAAELFKAFRFQPLDYAPFALRSYHGPGREEKELQTTQPDLVVKLLNYLSFFRLQENMLHRSQVLMAALFMAHNYMPAYSSMQYMLEHRADPETPFEAGRLPPLWDAARRGDEVAVRLLIQYHANVNRDVTTGYDTSPALRLAIEQGYASVAKLLAEQGAQLGDVDALAMQLQKQYAFNLKNVLTALESAKEGAKMYAEKNRIKKDSFTQDTNAVENMPSPELIRHAPPNENKQEEEKDKSREVAITIHDSSAVDERKITIAQALPAAESESSRTHGLMSLAASLFHLFTGKKETAPERKSPEKSAGPTLAPHKKDEENP